MNPELPPPLPAVAGDYAAATLLPLVSDVQIHCVLMFPEPLDAARLARAVRLGFEAEPVLGCNLELARGRLSWRRRDMETGFFHLEQSESPEAALAKFLSTPLDAFHDPLAQACLINGTTLCLKVSHIAGDAAAVKSYAYLLADIYRHLGDDPAYIPLPNCGSRSLRQLSREFSFADKLRILRRGMRNNRDLWFPPRNWQLPLQPSRQNTGYTWRSLDKTAFAPLKAYAKAQHGATLHDLLLTALCRALLERLQPQTGQVLRLVTTADLRRYLPDGQAEAVCNLSGFVYLNLGTDLGATFADTLEHVSKAMTRQKNDCLGLGDLPLWGGLLKNLPLSWSRALLHTLFTRGKARMPPALTNMGALDGEALDFGCLPEQAFLLPSAAFAPNLVVGVSSFAERLTLSVGFTGGEANHTLVNDLLEKMSALLEKIMEKPA